MAKILLLEPNYKNKYPPIGLMKISTYHKMLGDSVQFFKGDLKQLGLSLQYDACIKSLDRINKNIDWCKRDKEIKLYLSTRRTKYLESILKRVPVKFKDEVILKLKFHANNLPKNNWDRIYITTLFTFYWSITIKTIEYAKRLVTSPGKIYVGGVMASLLKEEITASTGILPITGLLDRPGILHSNNNIIIDELPLDYSILGEVEYQYPTQSAYFTYIKRRGVISRCSDRNGGRCVTGAAIRKHLVDLVHQF